jgi:hypothetical protein
MRPRARLFVLVLLSGLMALPHAGQALPTVHGNRVVTPVPASNTPHVLDGEVFAILPVGHRVYVGGNFTQVRNAGSQAALTRRGLFAFDAGSGLVDPAFVAETSRFDDRHPSTAADRDGFWCRTETETFLRDVDFSPDGRYFVVVTTGWSSDKGPLCDAASRWETSARGSGLQPTWVDWTGGDTLTAVAVTDGVVYVGGHQRWLNNQAGVNGTAGPGSLVRQGLAALDPRSGLPLAWNPGRERGEGVWSLVTTPQGLWVGSDTDRLAGAYHGELAFLPLAGGSAAPATTAGTLPADVYTIGADQRIARRSFDGSVLGTPAPLAGAVDWTRVRAAFSLNGWLYTAQDDGRLLRRSAAGDRFEEVGAVNLRGITPTQFRLAGVTGMFYDSGRLYYTLAGDRRLWYRNFVSETNVGDDVVGAEAFVASGADDSLDWSRVKGLGLLSGKLYRAEGADLRRIDFAAGRVLAATLSLVAPLIGAESRAVFLVPRPAAPTPAPAPSPAPTPPLPAGTTPAPASPAPGAPRPGFVTSQVSGYWMVGRDGTVHAFGGARHLGNATLLGRAESVDLEATPSANGYWILDDAGRIDAFGDARHRGDLRGTRLAGGERATSLSATPTGAGYWIFTTRGRALAFGDAGSFGDLSAVTLNGPVVDSVRTPSRRGYYLVAADGGIFTFGDARFAGSMGGKRLNQPVQSLVPDPDGAGYWLVAADGGVFAFDAPFRGSLGSQRLNRPVTGMVAYGNGYLMVGEDGGIFNFSDRSFVGSLGAAPPAHPVVAVAGV